MDSTVESIESPIDASREKDDPALKRIKQDRKAEERAAIVARLSQLPGVIVASAMTR